MDHELSPADHFETDRPHLRAVALRILANPQDADDAVQEKWPRLSTADTATIDNLTGWLTTVVSRNCLNMLRSRRRLGREPVDDTVAADRSLAPATMAPEDQAVLADSLSEALLVVLDRRRPAASSPAGPGGGSDSHRTPATIPGGNASSSRRSWLRPRPGDSMRCCRSSAPMPSSWPIPRPWPWVRRRA